MPNNSPPLFWRFKFQNYLPATYLLRVCLYHPVNNQPRKPICHPHLPQRRPSCVTASRPATLINAHHRLTTLPPSTFWPCSAPVCPSLPLFCFLLSSVSVALPSSPDAPFALHNFSITSQIVDLKQGSSVVIESYT
jgi:hypothetical protein